MIDIETIGVRSTSMLLQIGACYFDRNTGEIGKTFLVNIDPSMFKDQFTFDYGTVKWWFEQTEEARKSVMENAVELRVALMDLHDFCDSDETNIWCHATFDMPIILNAFEVMGIKFPIHFRRMRDIRTLMDIADHKTEKPRQGIHHNGLDDAKFQVVYVVEALNKLKGMSAEEVISDYELHVLQQIRYPAHDSTAFERNGVEVKNWELVKNWIRTIWKK